MSMYWSKLVKRVTVTVMVMETVMVWRVGGWCRGIWHPSVLLIAVSRGVMLPGKVSGI